MFLLALGLSLTLGAAAFATALYSDGTVLALRSAAQIIGWLLIAAALAGATMLKRREVGGSTAVMVSLGAGMLLLYLSLLDSGELAHAAANVAGEARSPVVERIENPSPALAAALGMKEIVIQPMPPIAKHEPVEPMLKVATPPASAANIARRERCDEKSGLARLLCQESARLEQCESGKGDEASCPSPIPSSYPG